MIRKWIKKLLASIIREVLREEETRIKEEAHQCVLETLGNVWMKFSELPFRFLY